ncbi:MAG: hypothetical protein HYW07_20685 [Candidatus Latescibacteria bacterium]|nr:hypothetical protein [Candidatus Latescibacterota bacterium]
MNTGQMMLVVAGMILLSTISLSVNSTLLQSDEVAIEAQAGMVALALCRGRLEEELAAGFDSVAIGVSAAAETTSFAVYACTTQVDYVTAASPDQAVAGPTSLKRVRVSAASPYLSGAITLSAIVGER